MKHSPVRARIRQMCCLGLPGEVLVPSLLPALRELVPAESGAFAWVDGRCEMRNLFAERLLPAPLISRYFERYYGGAQGAFARGVRERARAAGGIGATSAEGELARSAYYNEILRPLEAHHVLYGVVQDGGGIVGQLSLYRPARARPFGDRDRAELASVARYVSHALAPAPAGTHAQMLEYEDSGEEALLVVDRQGGVRHATAQARRLLLLATASEINARSLKAGVNDTARGVLRALCARLGAASDGADAGPPSLTCDSRWGRHVLSAYWLDEDMASPDALVAVRIRRQQPRLLNFVRAMGRLALSPQQREIAVLIAQGLSNQQIGAQLGVSTNTVAYHVKQLFAKLDVHDRAAAIARIRQAQPVARD